MHGQGRGRNERNEQTDGEGASHAVPMKGPAAAIEHERLKGPQTPEFLQRMAVRCDAFQPALHGLRSTPTAALCRFQGSATVIRCQPPNQRVRFRPMKYHSGSFVLDLKRTQCGRSSARAEASCGRSFYVPSRRWLLYWSAFRPCKAAGSYPVICPKRSGTGSKRISSATSW